MVLTKDIFIKLQDLYAQMDTAWDETAVTYGFQCNGCEDNCCRSLFFHHTQVEKAYLVHGFEKLDIALKTSILENAEQYIEQTFDRSGNAESKKILCPVNKKEKCLLYPYRPMICRLHGLPHQLTRPDGEILKGTGCNAGQFESKSYTVFDRTPFYQQMARTEMAFRSRTGQTGKIKETVAQMILSHTVFQIL